MTVSELVSVHLRARVDLPEPSQRAALRKATGLTQKELADILGVNRSAIANWESGHRNPAGTNLVNYVEALGVLKASTA
jgi:transcriptional regulator with XRE-family HTH domain